MELLNTIDFDCVLWLLFGIFLMFIGTIPVFVTQDKRFPYESKTDSSKVMIITFFGMVMIMAAIMGFAINEYSFGQILVITVVVLIGGFIPIVVFASR